MAGPPILAKSYGLRDGDSSARDDAPAEEAGGVFGDRVRFVSGRDAGRVRSRESHAQLNPQLLGEHLLQRAAVALFESTEIERVDPPGKRDASFFELRRGQLHQQYFGEDIPLETLDDRRPACLDG